MVDEAFLMIDEDNNGAEYWAYPDERGSVVATAQSNGFVNGVHTYDEYGRQGGNIDSPYPFRYTGQRWDGRLGMYYYKARHYDPQMGRFLQPDPIGYGDGLNIYNYVGGDPVGFRDPSGTCGTRIRGHSAPGCATIIAQAEVTTGSSSDGDGGGGGGGGITVGRFGGSCGETAASMVCTGNFARGGTTVSSGSSSSGLLSNIGSFALGFGQSIIQTAFDTLIFNTGGPQGPQGLGFFLPCDPFQGCDLFGAPNNFANAAGRVTFFGAAFLAGARGGGVRGGAINFSSRPITPADLGITSRINELSGTVSMSNGVLTMRVNMIDGRLGNPITAMNNMINTARSTGASSLRIEGTFANPRFQNFFSERFDVVTNGANDVIIIPLN